MQILFLELSMTYRTMPCVHENDLSALLDVISKWYIQMILDTSDESVGCQGGYVPIL